MGVPFALTRHACQKTSSKVLYMTLRERLEAILLEKVEHAHTQQLRDDTGMIPEIKVLIHVDALAVRMSAQSGFRRRLTKDFEYRQL